MAAAALIVAIRAAAAATWAALAAWRSAGAADRSAGEPITVTIAYSGEDSPYRGRTSFRLHRVSVDAAGSQEWRSDSLRTERID